MPVKMGGKSVLSTDVRLQSVLLIHDEGRRTGDWWCQRSNGPEESGVWQQWRAKGEAARSQWQSVLGLEKGLAIAEWVRAALRSV